jgi:hypothetical protein
MRNSLAKKLRLDVAVKLFVGEGVSKEDVLKDKKSVYASDEFKSVYRARKKNHNRTIQRVKHMDIPMTEEEKVEYANMRKARIGKRKKFR